MSEVVEPVDARAASDSPSTSARRGPPRSETRFADEAAFVLHATPYKETSLIVDALTRRHGRIALVARGAKRPRSALRGVLQAFQPLTLGWVQSRARAGGELRTLTRAEWVGGLRPLRAEALMSGFYLNELIQKLLARDDPHEALFDAYLRTLAVLSDDGPAAPVLRHFEQVLLREAGYAVRLTTDAAGDAIDARARYRYLPERGAVRAEPGTPGTLDGKTLLDIDAGDYADESTLAQAKRLMRQLLRHHLGGQELQTRKLVHDLHRLEQDGR